MQITPLTPQIAEELGLRDTRGALIYEVSQGAYQAGFRRFDVITSFNGQEIQDTSQLLRVVADAKVGSTATVDLVRDGRRVELRVPVVAGSEAASRRRGL
jgi:serine protease Do